MTAAANAQAWTVDHIETEPLDDTQRAHAVNELATLINSWNESQRSVLIESQQ